MKAPSWRFDPWDPGESALYNGVRLLLVGESHYDEQPELLPRSHTRDVVRDYGIGDSLCATKLFKNAYRAFSGDFDLAHPNAKANFWGCVCYCNYFQRPMKTPGETPTDADCIESAAPFGAMLRHVKPDGIVVMSQRLWTRYMKKIPCVRLPPIGPLNRDDAFKFDIGAGRYAPAVHIPHPSPRGRPFSPEKWHPYLTEFLDHCRAQK